MDDRALARALDLAHVLDTDLAVKDGGVIRPLVAYARKLAVDATHNLINAAPGDVEALKQAQNAVWRAQALVAFVRDAFDAAKDAWDALDPSDQAEISTLILTDPDQELEDA